MPSIKRLRAMGLVALLLSSIAIDAAAQSEGLDEVVVTGSRRTGEAVVQLPAVTIRKRADFLVQAVSISNDTRDAKSRETETYQTHAG